jgi:hypothetical protein
MKTTILLAVALVFSVAVNFYLLVKMNDIHIQPRAGKDVSVEMKSFVDGSWGPVVLVHGYVDNYPAAKEIVDYAEKTSGRPSGSFRTKVH